MLLSFIERSKENFIPSKLFSYSEKFRKQSWNIFVMLKVQQYVNGIWIWMFPINTTSAQYKIMWKKKKESEYFSMWVLHSSQGGWHIVTPLHCWLSKLKVNLCCKSKPRWYYNDSNSFYHFFVCSLSNTKKINFYQCFNNLLINKYLVKLCH